MEPSEATPPPGAGVTTEPTASEPAHTPGTEGSSSYRQILRATSIVGGGKVLAMLIGLVRTKVLAVLLGPSGIGLMGLLQGVMSTGSTLFGLGLGSSGVRQIAASGGNPEKLATVRRALWWSNVVLGVVGLGVVWGLKEPIAGVVFGSTERAADVGWMGVGILVSLIAASQTALLQGMRRIGDMVKASLLGALFGSAAGITVVWVMGEGGVRWFILATPVFSVVAAAWYARRLPRPVERTPLEGEFWDQWKEMASLGVFLMLSALAGSLAALAVRAILANQLGVDAAGHFQAANAISTQYLGLVLGAMAADYYPRLTEAVRGEADPGQTVNEQLEVALLLMGPILLAVLALAPWILTLLYSADFQVAAGIMRWQMLGDVLKMGGWALGFLILAHGHGKVFLSAELATHAVFVGAVYLLLPLAGLEAAGIGFWLQYVFYFPVVLGIAHFRYGYSMGPRPLRYLLALIVGSAAISASAQYSEWLAGALGVLLASAAGVFSLKRLRKAAGVKVQWR